MTEFKFTAIKDFSFTDLESNGLTVLLPIYDSPAPISEQLAEVDQLAQLLPGKDLLETFAASSKCGKVTSYTIARTTTLLLGVGSGEAADVISAIGKCLRENTPARVLIALTPSLLEKTASANLEGENAQRLSAVAAACYGAKLGSYRFGRYRQVESTESIQLLAPDVADCKQAALIADRALSVRDLVNTAPNHLNPDTFRELIEADQKDLEIEIFDLDRLKENNCGGILGVGQGSAHPPLIARVAYVPKNARGHVAVIGKGITFDTGGLSLKINDAMEWMKSDMAGAATAWQAALAVRDMGLPVRFEAWLAIAENMPDRNAQRVDDVVTMANGLTVEIKNTDCEGRMVMADALALAAKTSPDLLLDIATLTGAQIRALGMRDAAVMGSPKARGEVVKAANAVAEPVWPMPLPKYLDEQLQTSIADLQNRTGVAAGMLAAGAFLRHFSGESCWAHIDIAGPSFVSGSPYGEHAKGGTGYGLRTLVEIAQNFAAGEKN